MVGERGKITFMSLIAFVILAVCAFMAFKYISSSLEKKQIKKEVFDTLGLTRGSDRENADIEELIMGILGKHRVEVIDLSAQLDQGRSLIRYSFTYKIVTDYLFFKRSEIVEVKDEIENYG